MRHGDPTARLSTESPTLTTVALPGHTALIAKPHYDDLPAPGLRPHAASPIGRIARTLMIWRGRWRQRRRLLDLTDHLLRDIGVTRAQAEGEGKKRFWQA